MNMGETPEMDKKIEKIKAVLQEKADHGDADACCKLANIYIAYSENIKDYIKAYNLAKRAYKAGNLESAFLLGEMNQFGTGCEKNRIRAKYYYHKLLRMTDLPDRLGKSTIIDLYCNLAKLNLSGKYKFSGNLKAKKYYQKAADLGYAKAQDSIDDINEHIGEYRNDFIGRMIFAICAVVTLIWAGYTIKIKCQPLYQHVYDSVISDAVRVADGNDVENLKVQESLDEKEEITDAGSKESKNYDIFSSNGSEKEEWKEIAATDCNATSEVKNSVGVNYPARNTIDGKKYTCWQEDENDDGIGQSLTYDFKQQEKICAIGFYNGNVRNEKAFPAHNRIQDIVFSGLSDQKIICEENITLKDQMEEQFIVFHTPIEVNQIKITIDSVYAEDGNHKTCLSEIRFFTE